MINNFKITYFSLSRPSELPEIFKFFPEAIYSSKSTQIGPQPKFRSSFYSKSSKPVEKSFTSRNRLNFGRNFGS